MSSPVSRLQTALLKLCHGINRREDQDMFNYISMYNTKHPYDVMYNSFYLSDYPVQVAVKEQQFAKLVLDILEPVVAYTEPILISPFITRESILCPLLKKVFLSSHAYSIAKNAYTSSVSKSDSMLRAVTKTAYVNNQAGESFTKTYPGRGQSFAIRQFKCYLTLMHGKVPILRVTGSNKSIIDNVISDSDLKHLFLGCGGPGSVFKLNGNKQPFYRLKSHPGASNKVNVYSSEVYSDLKSIYPALANEFSRNRLVYSDLYDDQVSAMYLLSASIYEYFGLSSCTISIMFLKRYDLIKELSTFIKSLGINNTRLGCMLCEGVSLYGRGVNSGIVSADLKYRVTDVSASIVHLDQRVLRSKIRQILLEELKEPVVFDDPNSFWTKRWSWCVNGAHNKLVDKVYNLGTDYNNLGVARVHRKVFVENVSANLLDAWSGESYFSASEKLELGKTRAIYGIDSVSYIAFEHLLRPVERLWLNRSVILDPGKVGSIGLHDIITNMRKRLRYNTMLDFDDFNSQHSIESMQSLFIELCQYTNYDKERSNKIIASFGKGYMYEGGDCKGLILGTLMSGHRATTFINSILNKAYILYACENLNFDSLHVGDDVFIVTDSGQTAINILNGVKNVGLRVNKFKQSMGLECGEFLRMSITDNSMRGYLCRSIGSIIAGNWENDVRLNALDGLTTMASSCWALCNRSLNDNAARLVRNTISRISGLSLQDSEMLCTGRLGIGNGPLRYRSYGHKRIRVVVEMEKIIKDLELRSEATNDYLSHHVTPEERLVIEKIAVDPATIMKNSSYRKTLSGRDGVAIYNTRIEAYHGTAPSVWKHAFDAWQSQREDGYFAQYPLLNNICSTMSCARLNEILGLLGIAKKRDPVEFCFGRASLPVEVRGFLSYNDAASLSSKGGCDGVITAVQFYV